MSKSLHGTMQISVSILHSCNEPSVLNTSETDQLHHYAIKVK